MTSIRRIAEIDIIITVLLINSPLQICRLRYITMRRLFQMIFSSSWLNRNRANSRPVLDAYEGLYLSNCTLFCNVLERTLNPFTLREFQRWNLHIIRRSSSSRRRSLPKLHSQTATTSDNLRESSSAADAAASQLLTASNAHEPSLRIKEKVQA